jgi:hypothetical protein
MSFAIQWQKDLNSLPREEISSALLVLVFCVGGVPWVDGTRIRGFSAIQVKMHEASPSDLQPVRCSHTCTLEESLALFLSLGFGLSKSKSCIPTRN